MGRSFNQSKNKKAFLALESLLGIIISVVALFFIFQIFFNVFFQTPTNLKIAEDNAKSIVEFIDFSDKKYSNSNDCYTTLRLSNLENYQFKDSNEKNYFYTINNKGVNIYLKKDFDIAINSLSDLKNLKPINSFKFKNNMKINEEVLTLDKTNFDTSINLIDNLNILGSIDYYIGTLNNYANFYNSLELKNSNSIIIYPVFGKSIFGADSSNYLSVNFDVLKINPTANNQNILYALNFEKLNTLDGLDSVSKKILNSKNFEGHYLVYTQKGKIFPTYSIDSENYINRNLCEYKNILSQLQNRLFSSKEDYFNKINKNKIILIKGKNNEEYKFKFTKSKKTCYKNRIEINCLNIFNKNIDNLDYNDFVKEIQNLPEDMKIGDATLTFEDKTNEEFFKNLFTEQKEKITLDIIENSFSEKYPNYKIYIIKRNIVTNSLEKLVGIDTFNPLGDKYLNNCIGDLCNFILYNEIDKSVYIYDDKYYKNFVKFNIKYLEKKKISSGDTAIYFNGVYIWISISAEFASKGWLGSRGLFKPISIRGYDGIKQINFLISNEDISKISELNFNKNDKNK